VIYPVQAKPGRGACTSEPRTGLPLSNAATTNEIKKSFNMTRPNRASTRLAPDSRDGGRRRACPLAHSRRAHSLHGLAALPPSAPLLLVALSFFHGRFLAGSHLPGTVIAVLPRNAAVLHHFPCSLIHCPLIHCPLLPHDTPSFLLHVPLRLSRCRCFAADHSLSLSSLKRLSLRGRVPNFILLSPLFANHSTYTSTRPPLASYTRQLFFKSAIFHTSVLDVHVFVTEFCLSTTMDLSRPLLRQPRSFLARRRKSIEAMRHRRDLGPIDVATPSIVKRVPDSTSPGTSTSSCSSSQSSDTCQKPTNVTSALPIALGILYEFPRHTPVSS
jgi:hypothetical protein